MRAKPDISAIAPRSDVKPDFEVESNGGHGPHRHLGAGDRVRSFVLRRGRLTSGQAGALRDHWPDYGVDAAALGNPASMFGNCNPVTLEIGFGTGDTLVHAALTHPNRNYLGMEVYDSGLGQILKAVHEKRIVNLRVWRGDAVEGLELIPDRSLDSIWIFFPDPWPKKRHHKRRLVNPAFAGTLARKLVARGRLLLATDWEDYAAEMLAALGSEAELENTAGLGNYCHAPIERIETRFARRARRLGHRTWDLCFRRRR